MADIWRNFSVPVFRVLFEELGDVQLAQCITQRGFERFKGSLPTGPVDSNINKSMS